MATCCGCSISGRAKAMMLLSRMAAPLASNTLAFWVKFDALAMPTTRRSEPVDMRSSFPTMVTAAGRIDWG